MLREVALQDRGPFTPSAKQRLDHFPHRAMSTGRASDIRSQLLYLLNRIRHRQGETHTTEYRQIGEIIPHEGHILPIDSSADEDLLECHRLSGTGHLQELVHSQLRGPKRRRFGAASADPHHGYACGLE